MYFAHEGHDHAAEIMSATESAGIDVGLVLLGVVVVVGVVVAFLMIKKFTAKKKFNTSPSKITDETDLGM